MASKHWTVKSRRPEDSANALDYYESGEGRAQTETNAVKKIQEQITLRAVQLANFELGTTLLDAGCGSGHSLSVLSELGFKAKGFDLSPRLVSLAKKKKLDATVGDLRKIPFPGASFGGLVSVSALQWLLSANYSEDEKKQNLEKCASEFWRVLEKGGKAVVQWYPRSEQELFWAGKVFKSAGFRVVVHQDNADNARKRKCFLVLEKPISLV